MLLAIGVALFALWALLQVVQLLTLPQDVRDTIATWREWLPALAAFLLILNLAPVRERMPGRARLSFGEPYTDPDKGIVKKAVYYRHNRAPGTPDFSTGTSVTPADFLHVKVRNESRVDALRARTVLSYAGGDGAELFRFDGRWAESPQLAEGANLRDITDILEIPAGRSLTVDLGFVERGSAEGYAFNTEDTARHPDWHNPRRRLEPGTYQIEILVIAKNATDLRGWFEVFVGGPGMSPTIRRVAGPSGQTKIRPS